MLNSSIVQKVMNAEGQLELKRETVNVIVDKSSEGLCASAGRRQLIKDSLRQSMSAKRAVDRLKKQNKVEKDDISSGIDIGLRSPFFPPLITF